MTDQLLRLRCACGWEASGTESELVAAATEHGRRVHNMTPTRDEVLAMVIADGPGAPDVTERSAVPGSPAAGASNDEPGARGRH